MYAKYTPAKNLSKKIIHEDFQDIPDFVNTPSIRRVGVIGYVLMMVVLEELPSIVT
jgi:hypothetical protein